MMGQGRTIPTDGQGRMMRASTDDLGKGTEITESPGGMRPSSSFFEMTSVWDLRRYPSLLFGQ